MTTVIKPRRMAFWFSAHTCCHKLPWGVAVGAGVAGITIIAGTWVGVGGGAVAVPVGGGVSVGATTVGVGDCAPTGMLAASMPQRVRSNSQLHRCFIIPTSHRKRLARPRAGCHHPECVVRYSIADGARAQAERPPGVRYRALRVAGEFGARSHEGAALRCGRRTRSYLAACRFALFVLRALRGASLLRVPDILPTQP